MSDKKVKFILFTLYVAHCLYWVQPTDIDDDSGCDDKQTDCIKFPKVQTGTKNVCVLPHTNELMKINEIREIKGSCKLVKCEVVHLFEANQLDTALPVIYRCPYLVAPFATRNESLQKCLNFTLMPDAEFPKCCPVLICEQDKRFFITYGNRTEKPIRVYNANVEYNEHELPTAINYHP